MVSTTPEFSVEPMLACADYELSAALIDQMQRLKQGDVLRFWDRLSPEERDHLALQLAGLDWTFVEAYAKERPFTEAALTVNSEICPPSRSIHLPETDADRQSWSEAADDGRAFLRLGRTAVVVVAGGMATRLGTASPKGMFPISPVSGRSLFHLLAEQVLALSQRYQVEIPYLVMTSQATHAATQQWFEDQHWFGLNPNSVFLFQQGTVPAFDSVSGKLLMSSESSLALNPDGHGGLPFAMSQAGLFQELRNCGVETLFYHQVDNPLVHVCDPAFIGMHLRDAADVSLKYVSKRTPDECLGLLVEINGRPRMIEYSDLPKEIGELRDPTGKLKLRAGNTGIHLFQRDFLERIAVEPASLPWHSVHKKVPYLDAAGTLIHPECPNALKYERFIFDSFSSAKFVLAVETDREAEFAPLKNAEGDCSADVVKQSLIAAAAKRLRAVGVSVSDGVPVEIANISPDDLLNLAPECPHCVDTATLFEATRSMPGDPFVSLHVAK